MMLDRTWKIVVMAVLLGPAVLMAGCKSGGGTTEATSSLAEPVAILGTKIGDSQALKITGVQLIKSEEQYKLLGDDAIYPGVDFASQDLVLVALGEQPTAGYAVAISAIQQEGSTLVVVGSVSKPGEDAAAAQVLTYPYAAALIANTDATLIISDID